MSMYSQAQGYMHSVVCPASMCVCPSGMVRIAWNDGEDVEHSYDILHFSNILLMPVSIKSVLDATDVEVAFYTP